MNITVTIFPRRNNLKPTLAIMFSLLVLISAIAAVLWNQAIWPWALGIVFINRLTFAIIGLIPRTSLLGPNITRLPEKAAKRGELAITIDDGPNPEVTPRVLDILDRYHAKATFFCIGKLVRQYPDLCREIVLRGHAIENHSFSHQWYFSLLPSFKIWHEVQQGQIMISEASGQTPLFFRPTAGLRNAALEPVLKNLGLRLCSWTKRGFDTQEGNAEVVLQRLTLDLKAGDILLLHDGSAAQNADGTPVILVVLPLLLDRIRLAKLNAVTLRSAFA